MFIKLNSDNYFYYLFIYVGMYTVEFQKRGLPHAHILLCKLKNSTDIDKVISAELPNADLYPKLEKVVSSYIC